MLANVFIPCDNTNMSSKNEPHDSRAVANEILRIAAGQGISVTIMQLLKLVFFAHGWSLATLDSPLTKDSPEAWKYGPVYPLIYKSYSGTGSAPITESIKDKTTGIEIQEQFTERELDLMRKIVGGYGKLHAYQLSNLTHAQGSPWEVTLRENGPYAIISNDVIRSYFRSLEKNAN